MTDAEKAALDWLNEFDGPRYAILHVRIIKAMLAEPRLPAEPSEEILREMVVRGGWNTRAYSHNYMRETYRALYALLTKPKTKMAAQWKVSWRDRHHAEPQEFYFDMLDIALPNYRVAANNAHYWDAALSGPHIREVPND